MVFVVLGQSITALKLSLDTDCFSQRNDFLGSIYILRRYLPRYVLHLHICSVLY